MMKGLSAVKYRPIFSRHRLTWVGAEVAAAEVHRDPRSMLCTHHPHTPTVLLLWQGAAGAGVGADGEGSRQVWEQ